MDIFLKKEGTGSVKVHVERAGRREEISSTLSERRIL